MGLRQWRMFSVISTNNFFSWQLCVKAQKLSENQLFYGIPIFLGWGATLTGVAFIRLRRLRL